MDTSTIIRAWKDPTFRASLSTEERAALPECPAGSSFTDIDEKDLEGAIGGGVPFNTRDRKRCFPIYIEPIRFPICYASNDPVLVDPRSAVINPAIDLAQFQFAL